MENSAANKNKNQTESKNRGKSTNIAIRPCSLRHNGDVLRAYFAMSSSEFAALSVSFEPGSFCVHTEQRDLGMFDSRVAVKSQNTRRQKCQKCC